MKSESKDCCQTEINSVNIADFCLFNLILWIKKKPGKFVTKLQHYLQVWRMYGFILY